MIWIFYFKMTILIVIMMTSFVFVFGADGRRRASFLLSHHLWLLEDHLLWAHNGGLAWGWTIAKTTCFLCTIDGTTRTTCIRWEGWCQWWWWCATSCYLSIIFSGQNHISLNRVLDIIDRNWRMPISDYLSFWVSQNLQAESKDSGISEKGKLETVRDSGGENEADKWLGATLLTPLPFDGDGDNKQTWPPSIYFFCQDRLYDAQSLADIDQSRESLRKKETRLLFGCVSSLSLLWEKESCQSHDWQGSG